MSQEEIGGGFIGIGLGILLLVGLYAWTYRASWWEDDPWVALARRGRGALARARGRARGGSLPEPTSGGYRSVMEQAELYDLIFRDGARAWAVARERELRRLAWRERIISPPEVGELERLRRVIRRAHNDLPSGAGTDVQAVKLALWAALVLKTDSEREDGWTSR